MITLQEIELAKIAAQKAGDRTRLDALRLLINEVKAVAKADKNREPVADDVITAANRMVKKANETLSFLPEGDDRRPALDAEVAVMQEFLPQRLPRERLHALISSIADSEGAPKDKSLRGFINKELAARVRGQYDAKDANEIIGEIV